MATEFIGNEFPTEEPIWIDNYFRIPRILFGSEVRDRGEPLMGSTISVQIDDRR